MGRRPISTILAVAAVTAAALVATPGPAASAAAIVRVVGSIVTVPPSGAVEGRSDVRLVAARNEVESVQLVVHGGDAGLTRVAVEVDGPLVSGDGAVIGTDEVDVHRAVTYDVHDVPSDSEGALGPWFDALVPQRDHWDDQLRDAFSHAGHRQDVAAGTNAVAWLDVHVPPGATPGRYETSVLVTADGFRQEVPLVVDVVDVLLPSTPTYSSVVGLNLNHYCPGHHDGGACPSAEAQWELARRYGMVAADNRVSMSNLAPGVPDNDRTRELFREFLLPLYQGEEDTRLPGARPTIMQLEPWIFDACTTDCVAAWRAEAERGGFADIVRYYDCDEVGGHKPGWDACAARLERARESWPGLRMQVTATVQAAAQAESLDVAHTLIPLVNFLDGKPDPDWYPQYAGDQRAAYDDWLDADPDREVWTYQACFSHGCEFDPRPAAGRQLCAPHASPESYWVGWPSLVIDAPASQHRAMGWVAHRYDVSGDYYYQSLVAYDQGGEDGGPPRTDPWKSQYCYGGHGDGTLFYPGTPDRIGGTTHVPVESIRMKRMRDGVEDNELLRLVAEDGHADEAREITRRLVPTAYRTTFGQAALDAARLELFSLFDAPLPGPAPVVELTRLAGSDRYATAAAVVIDSWDDADVVLLARGDLFPDSLAASFLAGALDAPVLLSTPDALPDVTLDALRSLGTTEVILLGGEVALGPQVESALEAAGIRHRRIAGDDRYDTARGVALEAGVDAVGERPGRGRTAVVSSGANFPDALSATPLSFALGFPLLLTRPDAVPDGMLDTLRDLGVGHILLTGAEVAIADGVENALVDAGFDVERVAGPDRYATAVAVAVTGLSAGLSPAHIDVARGDLFADALVGGPHAGRVHGTLVLTRPDAAEDVACDHLGDVAADLESGHVLGGEVAVADGVVLALERCAARDPDEPMPTDGPTTASEEPTEPDPVPPPTDLSSSATSSTSVRLTWTPADGIDGHRVGRLVSAGGNCPRDASVYTPVSSPGAGATSFTDNGLAADTTYCHLVRSTQDGRASAATAATVVATTTPSTPAPTSTDIDLAADTDGKLGDGDRVVVTFDLAPTVVDGDTLRIGDHEGDEVVVTCAADADCAVAGTTLTVELTGAPTVDANRGDGVVDLGDHAVVLASSIGNARDWNLARSGRPPFERVFGTGDPTNTALRSAPAAGDVTVDPAGEEVTLADVDCSPFPDYGTVYVLDRDGAQLGVASDDADATCDVTVSAAIASGDEIHVLYRIPGPFTVSQTLAVTVP